MKPEKLRDYLLNKKGVKRDNRKPNKEEDEFCWLRIKNSYICINIDGSTYFIPYAPWIENQKVESRLAYDILREMWKKVGIHDKDASDAYFAETMDEVNKAYLVITRYHNIIKSSAYKKITKDISSILTELS